MSLKACARCHGPHDRIVFKPFTHEVPADDDKPSWTHWATCPTTGEPVLLRVTVPDERRAPVNGAPYGTIGWAEHEEAWQSYARLFGGQSAERIAERGGFGLVELVQQLGGLPRTWEPGADTLSWWWRYRK